MISSEYSAKRPDGNRVVLTVNIDLPERTVQGDFYCQVTVPELSFTEKAFGVDAVQSFCMVIRCLRFLFEPLVDQGWRFFFDKELEQEIDILSHYL